MKCPYCNEEMEKGFVESSSAVLQWSKKLHRTTIGMWLTADSVDIADEGYAATAYICKNCETVIIPYGRNMEEATQEDDN